MKEEVKQLILDILSRSTLSNKQACVLIHALVSMELNELSKLEKLNENGTL